MPRYSLLRLAVLASLLLADPRFAGAAGAAESADEIRVVKIGDLDLKAPSGVAVLHHRIALAARDACAWIDAGERMDVQPFADCVRDAIRAAAPQAAAVVARAQPKLILSPLNIAAR